MRRNDVRRRQGKPLGVAEVARVLERDAEWEGIAAGARLGRLEQLADIADARREGRRPLRPGRVVAQQPAELLQVRSAAGRVDDDELDVRGVEGRRSACGRRRGPRRAGRRGPTARRSSPARGAATSKPSAASTRAVAVLTEPKTADWTQPVSSPTRPSGSRLGERQRRWPGGRRAREVRSRRAVAARAAAARAGPAPRAGAPHPSASGREAAGRAASGRGAPCGVRSKSRSTVARVVSISRS